MCLKFKEKTTNPFTLVSLIDDNYEIAFGLFLFASNIRREVCGVLDSFLSFWRKFEGKKTHNMLSLILNPRFKSLRLVFSFAGREEGVSIVDEYDKRTCILCI
jgi:hypothetical protein